MIGEYIDKVASWEFLGETAAEWFIFLGLLIVSLAAWRAITDYID